MSNNLGEQFRDIIENIRATGRRTHSGVVMVSVSIIEEKLALALKAMMISLSNDRYKKLFENYGPLNTFAAKIDMAHALGIIPLDMYEELHKIKKLRNKFAHSTDILNFESEEVLLI
jgi:DNA-binding MltR family transcriptional regulator